MDKRYKAGLRREIVDTELARFLDKYGHTDTFIAELIGVDRRTVYTFVRDPLRMKLEYLVALSDGLGVDLDYLLGVAVGTEKIKDFESEDIDWDSMDDLHDLNATA